MKFYSLYLPTLLLLGFSANLNATTFEAAANINNFNYTEFSSTGKTLDEETGFLPGIKFKISQQHNNNSYVFYSSYNTGNADYSGGTQSGQPHTTQTEEQIFQLGFGFISQEIKSLSGQLSSERYISSRFISGLRQWVWDRNILDKNNIRGLHEIYTWNEISIGLNFQTKIKHNDFYWSNITALYVLNPKMQIFLETSNETLILEQKPGFRFDFGKTWNITKHYSYSISIILEYWRFGRSNTVFTNDFFGRASFITEPDSETLISVLEFNYLYYF